MTPRWLRSLQARLAVRLALVCVLVALGFAALLAFRAYDVAATLQDRDLRLRALDLARSVVVDEAGAVRLDLPASLEAAYASDSGDVFAIRTADGRVLAARPQAFGALVATWPLPSDEPDWFRVESAHAPSVDYFGLNIAMDSAAGPVFISVAQADGAHALVESVVSDFLFEAAWSIPMIFLLALGAGVLAIRGGLAPLREASQIAAQIGPAATAVRLPEQNLPDEIAPLVSAVNRALDRLDQGFAMQRDFTANAAHELRTPLAILTAGLDALPASEDRDKLKGDVARMNRLVEQLLRVARLDAVALDVSGSVDLNAAAAETVAAMAPLAIAGGRTIELVAPDESVLVRGNRHAIEDALRNLIENALMHSPHGGAVTVSVESPASVSVADRGPSVPVLERERIFERFARGAHGDSGGAGLGLAIVREIMRAHGGAAVVSDNPGGGAVFTLQFAAPDQA